MGVGITLAKGSEPLGIEQSQHPLTIPASDNPCNREGSLGVAQIWQQEQAFSMHRVAFPLSSGVQSSPQIAHINQRRLLLRRHNPFGVATATSGIPAARRSESFLLDSTNFR
ncbi:hypothetical protein JTE90_026830 [Oedothorax gibbosus]|uniref:Uncharacterized protein n=1 Tax=Oedothorax gibbosus TaxID=931172 RepID=A0AAV6V6T3_9ARAC|nr:hypothetical protein JTE90_026830 [Oedothorax gibbosus]